MTVQEIKGKKLVKGIAPNVQPEALLNDKRKVFLFYSLVTQTLATKRLRMRKRNLSKIIFRIMNTLRLWIMRRMRALNW